MYIMKNRSSKKVNNKNIVNLKVKETIDLTSPLIEIDNLKKRMVEEGKTQKGNLQSKEKDIEKSINDKQNKISKLKDSFDKIIQKARKILNYRQIILILSSIRKKISAHKKKPIQSQVNKSLI